MSIVLPRKDKGKTGNPNSNRFAPSKCLQDAKEKLGPIYYNSRLVECPQNAIELSKLLQQFEDLDKKCFRVKEETRRKQTILLHNLASRYSFTKNTSLQSLQSKEMKVPPVGFRYHADGTPKLCRVPILAANYEPGQTAGSGESDSSLNSEIILKQHFIKFEEYARTQITAEESDENISEKNQTTNRDMSSKSKDRDLLKISEKLINKIKKELELNQKDLSKWSSQSKRASVSFQMPTSSNDIIRTTSNIKSGPSLDRILSKGHCTSCLSKIKHSNDDFNAVTVKLSRRESYPLTPWKLAMQAKSLENKDYSLYSIHPSRPKTASSGNIGSVSSMSRKLSKPSSEKMLFARRNNVNSLSRSMSARVNTKSPLPASLAKSVQSMNIDGRTRSESIIRQRVKEETEECEAKVQDFLHRLKSSTESVKPSFSSNT